MGKAGFSRVALACVLVALGAAGPAAAQTPSLARPQSSVLVVLDASHAMSGKKLAVAKRALVGALRELPEGTPVGVRVYGGRSCTSSRQLAPVAPVNADAVGSKLGTLDASGRAPVGLALSRAARDLPQLGQPSILLLAAGPDTCERPPPCRQTTVGSAKPPPRVDAIGLAVDPAARRGLQCAAQATGGVYRDVPKLSALGFELRTMIERATRDRRSLGKEVAGGLRQSEATSTSPGEYVDAIEPDSERWYSLDVPVKNTLSVAATLAAPRARDMSALGSSLELQLLDPHLKTVGTATATNLFSFQPDRDVTLNASVRNVRPGRYRVHVALGDSPDKQLAGKLGGRALPVELVFQVTAPEVDTAPPRPAAGPKAADVSWPAAAGGAVGCALLVLAAVALAPRRKARSAEEEQA